MGFVAEHTYDQPPWDTNTDEVTVSVAASGVGTTTIPSYCEYVWISTNMAHIAGVFISPDATDVDSGVFLSTNKTDGTGAPYHLKFPVSDGVVIQLHNASGATTILFNIVRFYNQPTN